MDLLTRIGESPALLPELASTAEWYSLSTRQHNAIFEGPEGVTEALVRLLQPYLRTPTIWKRAPTPLELPRHECGAVVLRNACALERHEQVSLLRWMDTERKQVVSTTVRPLFPLIAQGLFDEALYYRLNVVLMKVNAAGTPSQL